MVTNTRPARPPRRPGWPRLGERPRVTLAALGMTVGFVVLALFIRWQPIAHGPKFGLAVLACVPIAFLRRWPLPALAVATATMAAYLGTGAIALPLVFMVGFAAYTVATRLPRRFSIRGALAAAAVLGVGLLFAWVRTRAAPPVIEGLEGLLPVVAAWFVGDSVAARRRYLTRQAEHLSEQAELERIATVERDRREISEERVRIARELHDVIAHGLAVITVQAGVGRRLMARRPEEAASALASIEEIGRAAQEELRAVLGLLREEDVGPATLAPAPRLADVKTLVETVRAAGTPVELRMAGVDQALSQGLEVSVYRVIQEALTNVVKHAPGARAVVDLKIRADEVTIDVTDDGGLAGTGLAGAGGPPSGHGIIGMRERVGAFGGTLSAGPAAGRGFRVLARIPLQEPV
ncbi:MAG TPA: histidine kinase [Streptosporangiaceae bacterium]